MKTSGQLILASLLSFAISGTAYAQAPMTTPPAASKSSGESGAAEANHHALSAHHASASAHARALHHHVANSATVNKEMAQEHVEHSGRALEGAKKNYSAVASSTASDEKLKKHNEAITEHHAKAAEHHAALKSELAKPTPDPKLMKEHAAAMHQHVKKAETENTAMKVKRKFKEPAEPPAAK